MAEPKVAIDREPPYILDQNIPDKNQVRLSRSQFAVEILAFIIISALVLRLGLGLGLKHPKATQSSMHTFSSKGILNDTSLAAITTSDNNRHIFFQDFNSSLRYTIFSNSTGS